MPGRRERMRSISSQNCRRDSGSTPVVGSSRISRSGIVDQAAAQPELLPHAAGQFLRRAVGKRREPGAVQQFGDSPVPFGARLPEQAAEKLDVLPDAEVGIEVLAQPLRHVGDARTHRGAMRRASPCRRRGRERCRTGSAARRRSGSSSVDLPTPSGPIKPDHAAGRDLDRDVVQRDHLAVASA